MAQRLRPFCASINQLVGCENLGATSFLEAMPKPKSRFRIDVMHGGGSMVSVMPAFAKASADTFLSDSERKVAEEEGFEPPVSLRPRLISSQVP